MDTVMKIIVIGHGMVGHKFLECLAESQADGLDITVLCEEPRPAYDRVHLSEFFAGKTAEDLSLVAPGFFERENFVLKLNAKAVSIDRAARTVTVSTGETLDYDKLVLATGSYPFVPPLAGQRSRATASCTARSKTSKRCANAARARRRARWSAAACSASNARRRCATWGWKRTSSSSRRA